MFIYVLDGKSASLHLPIWQTWADGMVKSEMVVRWVGCKIMTFPIFLSLLFHGKYLVTSNREEQCSRDYGSDRLSINKKAS